MRDVPKRAPTCATKSVVNSIVRIQNKNIIARENLCFHDRIS